MASATSQSEEEQQKQKTVSAALLTSAQITEEVSQLITPISKLTTDLGELFVCVICQNPMENPMATSCGHSFCPDCLAEWLKKQSTCPVCRGIVTTKTVQQPVLLRDAIQKYNELKPVVNKVETVVTDLQRRVKSAQNELRNQRLETEEKDKQLQEKTKQMRDLEREASSQRAEHEKAEQILRETNEKLEQMRKQLQEADRSRALLAEKAQKAEQARRTEITSLNQNQQAMTMTVPNMAQQHSSSSGIWGTLSNLATNLLPSSIKPQQESPGGTGRFLSINDYHVLERRGNEVGCLVNRAISKKTNISVALKHVELLTPPRTLSPVNSSSTTTTETATVPEKMTQEQIINRFSEQNVKQMTEAYVLSNINHEGIVKLTSLIRDPHSHGSCFYFEMPFMEYDLDFAIKERLIGPLQASNITEQLLKAISYLHSHSISHRCICPASILIRGHEPDPRSSNCKIVLSGLSQSCSAPFSSNPLRFLTCYHPPECFYNGISWDSINWCLVDVWSIGTILGEILLGKPFFTIPSLKRLATASSTTTTTNRAITPPIMQYVCSSGFAELNKLLPKAPLHAVELLQILLLRNPNHRVSASMALNNKFFRNPLNSPGSPSVHSPDMESDENSSRQQNSIPMDEQSIRKYAIDHWQGLF